MMIQSNVKNGFGYEYRGPWQAEHNGTYFGAQTDQMVESARSEATLVVGEVGVGKSHLIHDLQETAATKGIASLILHAHINGGSKKGVPNALDVLSQFTDMHPDNGLIIVDNACYYGYSGQRAHRRYQVALAHLEVAERIQDAKADGFPIIATSHDELWRDAHWRFGATRGDDEVTPAAQALLDSFPATEEFAGELDPEIARNTLATRFLGYTATVLDGIVEDLGRVGQLRHRYVEHIVPEAYLATGIEGEVSRITQGAMAKAGSA